MKKRWLAGLMARQYKKLPVTMKMWMQFNVMSWTSTLVQQATIDNENNVDAV